MSECRHFRQQARLDVLPRDEELGRIQSCVHAGLDEILALRDEEPELVAPAAVVQLADELELLVLARGDQDLIGTYC
jgi:hypothetical protein